MAMEGKIIAAGRRPLAAAAEEGGNPGRQVLGVPRAVAVAAVGAVADSVVRQETTSGLLE